MSIVTSPARVDCAAAMMEQRREVQAGVNQIYEGGYR